nr:serum amyloid P-component-like [Solea senegalensis]
MEKLLLLFALISTCFAAPQDLSNKVFVFPKETNTDHIKLLTTKTQFNAFTVCLRFFTDLKRPYGLFSLATPTKSNSLVIYKPDVQNVLRIHAVDPHTDFQSVSFAANAWHSLCTTWSSDNGLAQVWLNGKPTIKRFITSGLPITGAPKTILGQEQDKYDGGFDLSQSFVGMISKVHMWDHVVAPAEIRRYMNGKYFTPGNVFNWQALEYEIIGKIYVEEDQENM